MATFNIRGKNTEVTPALREYVEKRVGKVNRYFGNIDEIFVLLAIEKDRHIVEVTAEVPGGLILRGEESTGDMYTSIDLVVEKLERQIRKQKTRLEKRFRAGGFKGELIEEQRLQNQAQAEIEEDSGEFPIVKTKRFFVKPMDVQEAILQMNLLNHNFFVFRDASTNDVCVVYKRKDGAYGLLESQQD
ncbi:MAG: ribosome-associated translation inhibitor RaiA [Selenomonadaceae bacterium]|nr:ribosome-associated translation inhibitor RaiA [Selenomonadaceae bacterium]